MASPVKISVIGAGSAAFSLALVKDLCLTEGLAGSLVSFMDVNTERLDTVYKLASRYAQELGADLRFEKTTDRQTSLRDADFVINTAYVKGHHHERAVRELIDSHGYYYGGRINLGSYYQLRLMLDVARDMEKFCPDAWLIQAGNPVSTGCTLLTRETGIKVCGLCHGHYGVYEIARTIGLEQEDRITWQAPGLNHNIWLTHFYYEGKDAYPLIDEWIETKAEEYWRTHVATSTHDVQMSRSAVHQYRMYGLFPIGDTVRRGGWWYHTDIDTKKYWYGEPWGGPDTHLARPLYVKNQEERMASMAELANNPKASVADALGTTRTREQHIPIIDALVNDNEGQFQVNVPNRGALEGVPDDVVVEVPAIVNKKGIQPIHVGALPPKIMLECILPEWLQMERTLLAFKTGDRSILLWQVLESHQTRSYEQAVAVLEDVMNMEGHEEMAEHYRFPPNWDLPSP
ncbi:MAG TPA: alpha-glucosidase/alpha-galactosidase [Caldilineae bacterium]|nr:alpha-glucosidase/alpha-galactosidase [Caldilineae bacterium]